MGEASLNIFQRMSAITSELKEVAKDLKVGTGERAYSATSETNVLDAVKPLEEKYGVYSYAADRSKETSIIDKEYTYQGQVRKLRLVKVDITVKYRFVNIDNPNEYVETISYGTGLDTGDKAVGKAMTYADKYALMKAYKISTGDSNDPDSKPSPENGFDMFEDLGDTPDPDNPMDYSRQQSSPTANGTGGGTPPTEGASAPQSPMTLEEAKAYVLPIGTHKGRTLGELLAIAPKQVEFYGGKMFANERYPDLKRAAQTILQAQ